MRPRAPRSVGAGCSRRRVGSEGLWAFRRWPGCGPGRQSWRSQWRGRRHMELPGSPTRLRYRMLGGQRLWSRDPTASRELQTLPDCVLSVRGGICAAIWPTSITQYVSRSSAALHVTVQHVFDFAGASRQSLCGSQRARTATCARSAGDADAARSHCSTHAVGRIPLSRGDYSPVL